VPEAICAAGDSCNDGVDASSLDRIRRWSAAASKAATLSGAIGINSSRPASMPFEVVVIITNAMCGRVMIHAWS
jgi:hypothetical protein